MTISLHNIALSCGDHCIFDDFSHEFTMGKIHAIMGRSGIGKTSLLRLMAGAIPHHGGEINIDGNIAMMAQNDQLLPWCDVWDNIFIGYHLRGEEISKEMQERAKALLQQASLDDWGKAYPNTLSGGMRQRVALIRTIMEHAPIILLDEPLSACDYMTKREIYPMIKQICFDNPQTTIIMICHDLHDARTLCDDLWLMQENCHRLTPYHDELVA